MKIDMKAWVLHGINDIRLEEVPVPAPAAREVLVRVKAAGICGSDIPRIYETGAHRRPLIPGHEFSGVVEGLGADVPGSWKDKPVGIFPLIPCRECQPCQNRQYEMCRNYNYLGSRTDGGFAEYVTVPVDNLVPLPEGVSYEETAMMEPMAVAVHAMRRVFPVIEEDESAERAKNDDATVVVCGLGTIGLLLIMFLKQMGIKNILAIGNKDNQRKALQQFGLGEDHYYDSRDGNARAWLMEYTETKGPDVFFECVGKKETVSLAVDSTAPAGKVCLIGNPHSDMALDRDVYWKILRNQLTLTGTWNSSFYMEKGGHAATQETADRDDWDYVLERLSKGEIRPKTLISHRFSLETLEQGFKIMRDKSEDYIKIMVQMED